MSNRAINICSFSAVDFGKKSLKRVSYADFRAAVLRAGRFSVFEATESNTAASLYTMLCRDPEIETDISCGYPWTIVRLKTPPATTQEQKP